MSERSAFRAPLVPKPDPTVRARRWAAWSFAATCTSVFLVQLLSWQEGSWLSDPSLVTRAFTFTACLMGILLAHELGHYAVARAHGFRLSLPWFLPFPFLIGTLGAIITLESVPRTRQGLLEMGAAGPLAGFAVVCVLLLGRLALGEAPVGDESGLVLGLPLIWRGLAWLFVGEAGAPISTQDPVAFACWVGCLVTGMNLVPIGQLDGGHVFSAMWPGRAKVAGWMAFAVLALAGWAWPGWWAWSLMLLAIGAREHLEPRQLGGDFPVRTKLVAAAALVTFVLTVMPVPLSASTP